MRRKPDDEPDLKRAISHSQIATNNDILGVSYYKTEVSYMWKIKYKHTPKQCSGVYVCVIYTGNATSRVPYTDNLHGNYGRNSLSKQILGGWPFNSVVSWFKVLLSPER